MFFCSNSVIFETIVVFYSGKYLGNNEKLCLFVYVYCDNNTIQTNYVFVRIFSYFTKFMVSTKFQSNKKQYVQHTFYNNIH